MKRLRNLILISAGMLVILHQSGTVTANAQGTSGNPCAASWAMEDDPYTCNSCCPGGSNTYYETVPTFPEGQGKTSNNGTATDNSCGSAGASCPVGTSWHDQLSCRQWKRPKLPQRHRRILLGRSRMLERHLRRRKVLRLQVRATLHERVRIDDDLPLRRFVP